MSGTESATSQQNCIPRTTRFETPGTGDIHRRVEWGMECNYEYRDRNDRPWSILRDSLGIFPEGCQGNQSSGRNSSQERYEYPARVPNTSLRHNDDRPAFYIFPYFNYQRVGWVVKNFCLALLRSSLDIRSTGRLSHMNHFVDLRTFKVALGITPEHGMRLFPVLFQLKYHDHPHNRHFMSLAVDKY